MIDSFFGRASLGRSGWLPHAVGVTSRDTGSKLLLHVESSRRRFDALERPIKNSAAGTEVMLKAELTGRLTHFETKIGRRIAELEDPLAANPPKT